MGTKGPNMIFYPKAYNVPLASMAGLHALCLCTSDPGGEVLSRGGCEQTDRLRTSLVRFLYQFRSLRGMEKDKAIPSVLSEPRYLLNMKSQVSILH